MVTGKNRVPKPAAGTTAFRIFMIKGKKIPGGPDFITGSAAGSGQHIRVDPLD
jgi:hypothetical protein|tara:strand:- start:2 stop:160 length:159 start_codon:yes stop_codon:yes gene_type:complete